MLLWLSFYIWIYIIIIAWTKFQVPTKSQKWYLMSHICALLNTLWIGWACVQFWCWEDILCLEIFDLIWWSLYKPDSILNDAFHIILCGTFVSMETTYYLYDHSIPIIWHPVYWLRTIRIMFLSNRWMYSYLSALLRYCQFAWSMPLSLRHMMSFEVSFIRRFIQKYKIPYFWCCLYETCGLVD